LLDELAHVRLRESSPGVYRLDHDSGRHDDRAVALALAVTTLLQDPAGAGFAPGLAEMLMESSRRYVAEQRATSTEVALGRGHNPTEVVFGTGERPVTIVPDADVRNSAGARHVDPPWDYP